MRELKAFLRDGLKPGLEGNATITSLLTAGHGGTLPSPSPIWADNAPPNSPNPLITFNEASDDSWDTSDTQGAELLVDVHVWTDQPSRSQATDLLEAIEQLCFDPAWTISGFTLVYCRPLRSRCEADGEGFHGTVTLRVIVGHG